MCIDKQSKKLSMVLYKGSNIFWKGYAIKLAIPHVELLVFLRCLWQLKAINLQGFMSKPIVMALIVSLKLYDKLLSSNTTEYDLVSN